MGTRKAVAASFLLLAATVPFMAAAQPVKVRLALKAEMMDARRAASVMVDGRHPAAKMVASAGAHLIQGVNESIDAIFFSSAGTLLLSGGGILTRLEDGAPADELLLVLESPIGRIHEPKPGLLFAEGVGGLWRSRDDGQTWEHVLDEFVVGSAAGASLVVAGGFDGELWVSNNEGSNWQLSNAATLDDDFFVSEVGVVGETIAYNAFVDPVRVSLDAGATWQQTEHEVSFLWSDDAQMYTDLIDGLQEIGRSPAGLSWQVHISHLLFLVTAMYQNEHVLVLVDGSELHYWSFENQEWRQFTDAIGGETISAFAIGPDAHLWVGTEEGSLRRSNDPLFEASTVAGVVSVTSLRASVGDEDAATSTFSITNTGTEPLPFTVSSASTMLSFAPASGEVAVGVSREIEVQADVSGLPSGVYQATISVDLAGVVNEIDYEIEVQSVTATEEAPRFVETPPHPNPATEAFTVTLAPSSWADVGLYDIRGRRVRDVHAGRVGGELRIDRGQLPPGAYFLRVLSERGTQALPVVFW